MTETNSSLADLLAQVRQRTWFYEFALPDGTSTRTDVPAEVLGIHSTRLRRLEEIIATEVPEARTSSALDLASHEGYFTVALGRHFSAAHGIELREDSVAAARMITAALGIGNTTFETADILSLPIPEAPVHDLVLLFGLLYHVENPLQLLRLASALTRAHLLIETQVVPYELTGRIEDGSYRWQREVHGLFAVCDDYASKREGGSTQVALVPSTSAVVFLLEQIGFQTIRVLDAAADDYEQFTRGHRVIVYAKK